MCIDAIRFFNTEATSSAKDLPQPTRAEAVNPAMPVHEPETAGGSDPEKKIESIDDGKHLIHRVLDGETGRVLCQVPSEEVLRVARNLEELAHLDEPQKIDSKA